jgi:hypothetical protein
MTDRDRFKLQVSPYRSPRVPVGGVLTCENRDDDVIVVGYSDARIPWPIGKRRGQRARALIIYGQLAEAVRRESNQAFAFHWGITPQTVTKWRKALDVPRANEGTHRLHHDAPLSPASRQGGRRPARTPPTPNGARRSPRPDVENPGRMA